MLLEIEGDLPIPIEELDQMVSFAASYLEIDEDAWITINFSDDMDENVCGFCDEVEINEKWIEIEVNAKLSVEELKTTIFHEMVHCQQILEGRLVQGSPSTWDGITYDQNYFELPWEVEAYELERKMVAGYSC